MSVTGSCRFVALAAATLTLLAGLLFAIWALWSADWQRVEISEFHQFHEHGLWRDRIKTVRHGTEPDDPVNKWVVNYKLFDTDAQQDADGADDQQTPLQHRLLDWHLFVFYSFVACIVFGLLALLFSFCSPFFKPCAIVWNLLTLISAICCGVGIVLFFGYSHQFDYRFESGSTTKYELETGRAFSLALISLVALIVTFVLSVLSTIILFVHDRIRQASTAPPKIPQSQLWPGSTVAPGALNTPSRPTTLFAAANAKTPLTPHHNTAV